MRNNFLLAIAMLLLFVTSCKKDEKLDSIDSNVEQAESSFNHVVLVEQAYVNLTPEEKNFFDPSYLSSTIISTTSSDPNQEQTHAGEREELDPIVNQVLEKILLLNDGDSFASGIIEDYGYPAWDKAIVSLSIDNSSVNGVHIPFSFIGGESVNSYLLAMVNPDGEISFAFIDGNFIDGIVGEGNIDFDISYHVTVFIKLNESLFGTTPEYLLAWLRLFSENNFDDTEVAATRCITTEMEICYWVCPYVLQDSSQIETRESCWECFNVTIEQGCDTGGGGGVGSGTTSTGGGINTGSNGGGSSSGNDGNNDGTPIFENILEFCGLTGDEGPGQGYELTEQQKKACEALDYLDDNEFPQANIDYLTGINQMSLLIQIANYIQQGGAYELSLATDYISLLIGNNTNLGFKEFKKIYQFLDDMKDDLTTAQYDWFLENIDILNEINNINNSSLPDEEKYEAIYNVIVAENIDPTSLNPSPIIDNNSPGTWPFTNWEEFTPAKIWEVAADIKADLIAEFPNKVQVINGLFAARVLGTAFEESSLASLGIPLYNQALPGNYTARPDGFSNVPIGNNETGEIYYQPLIIDAKMRSSTSPIYVFDYNSSPEQRNQFLQYLDYLEENSEYNETSAGGGLYLTLPAGVIISEAMVIEFATDKNIGLYISRAEIDQDDPTKIRISDPLLINWEGLNYESHFFSFLGKGFMSWALQRILTQEKFNYDKVDFDLQKHADIFKITHLGG